MAGFGQERSSGHHYRDRDIRCGGSRELTQTVYDRHAALAYALEPLDLWKPQARAMLSNEGRQKPAVALQLARFRRHTTGSCRPYSPRSGSADEIGKQFRKVTELVDKFLATTYCLALLMVAPIWTQLRRERSFDPSLGPRARPHQYEFDTH